MQACAVDRHGVFGVREAAQLAQDLDRVGSLADPALEREVDVLHDMGVEAGAGHQQEAAAVGDADADRARPAERDGARHGAWRGAQADLGGQHVGGAERHDRERQAAVAQAVHGLVDGAVAAGDHEQVVAVRVGARGQLLGIAARAGRPHGDLAAQAAQFGEHRVEPPPSPRARRRVEDDQQSSLGDRNRHCSIPDWWGPPGRHAARSAKRRS